MPLNFDFVFYLQCKCKFKHKNNIILNNMKSIVKCKKIHKNVKKNVIYVKKIDFVIDYIYIFLSNLNSPHFK